jgi:hypothetical protein
MTEEEWLACEDPLLIADWLSAKHLLRKYRLLNCACCRVLSRWLVDKRLIDCVDRAEAYADGNLTERTLVKWGKIADDVGYATYTQTPALIRASEAIRELFSYRLSTYPEKWAGWRALCHDGAVFGEPFSSEARAVGRNLLHCVFGNPFHPITLLPLLVHVYRGIPRHRHLFRPCLRPHAHPCRCNSGHRLRQRGHPQSLPRF